MSKKDLAKNKSERETIDVESYLRRYIEHRAHSMPVSGFVGWLRVYLSGVKSAKAEELVGILEERIDRLEANMDTLLKKEKVDAGREGEWPSYASEDFEKIVKNIIELESAGDDKSRILYNIMEIEVLLRRVERKARVTNQEYEARLAASLRDICRIHEPSEFSDEQIKRFTGSLHALIEGWGELNREKVKWVRSRLLEVGLIWLPVTEKAQKVIDEVKSSLE